MGNIDVRMLFNNFQEFYDNRFAIKDLYNNMSDYDKSMYKLYVYSNRIIKYSVLHKIWEYLNEPFGSIYYVTEEGLKEFL